VNVDQVTLQVYCNGKATSNSWQMEDDLNFLENGRRPQLFGKWKTISIFQQLLVNVVQVTLH
jgi:hypothetical protein